MSYVYSKYPYLSIFMYLLISYIGWIYILYIYITTNFLFFVYFIFKINFFFYVSKIPSFMCKIFITKQNTESFFPFKIQCTKTTGNAADVSDQRSWTSLQRTHKWVPWQEVQPHQSKTSTASPLILVHCILNGKIGL